MKTQSFIDIAPSKEKKVCENCKHFMKYGVVSGSCLRTDLKGNNVRMDYQTCRKFDRK